MSQPVQLDFFDEVSEYYLLKKEIDVIHEKTENVRRGLFVRHNDVVKLILAQQKEIDSIKSMIGNL